MPKKTALRTPQQRETSVREPGGLIDRGENAQESATAKSALTNRSHRTHSIRSHRMRETDLPCKIIPRGGPGRRWPKYPLANGLVWSNESPACGQSLQTTSHNPLAA